MKRSQIWSLVEEAWKIDPIKNEVPAMIMDLHPRSRESGKYERLDHKTNLALLLHSHTLFGPSAE